MQKSLKGLDSARVNIGQFTRLLSLSLLWITNDDLNKSDIYKTIHLHAIELFQFYLHKILDSTESAIISASTFFKIFIF